MACTAIQFVLQFMLSLYVITPLLLFDYWAISYFDTLQQQIKLHNFHLFVKVWQLLVNSQETLQSRRADYKVRQYFLLFR
jgi:hypothetical protein